MHVCLLKVRFFATFSTKKQETNKKKTQMYRLWWGGFACVALGNLGPFAALSFAPQSIVSPMHSFTLVANLFFARFFIGEKLQKTDILGVFLICTGAVVSVVAGSHYNPDSDLAALKSNYGNTGFQIYIILIGVIIIVEWYLVTKIIGPLRGKLQDCMDKGLFFFLFAFIVATFLFKHLFFDENFLFVCCANIV